MSKKRPRPNGAEQAMAAALDSRAITDDISAAIQPILARALREKWEPSRIRNHPMIACLLEAKKVTIALEERDSLKALAAIKDINDRSEGKAKERVEQTHKYEKLKDEELDALLASEEESLRSQSDEQQH